MKFHKILLFTGLFLFTWFLRAHYFDVPFERDEGEYAYIANLMQHGGVAYKDAINQKPPAVFFTYALFFKTLGDTPRAVHEGLFFYNLISILLIYLLTKKLYDEKTAFFSSFIFAFLTSERRLLAHAANTEIFMLMPMIASWLFALKENKRFIFLFTAGLFAGFAFLYKQVAFTSFIGVVAFISYAGFVNKKTVNKIVFECLTAVSGFIVPLVLVLYYYKTKGALGEFVYFVIKHNIEYSTILQSAGVLRHFMETFKFILQSQFVWWSIAAFAVYKVYRSESSREKSLIIWFLASWAGVCAGWRFTLHYFLQLMPVLSILCGYGVIKIIEAAAEIKKPFLKKIAVPLFLTAVIAVPLKANWKYYTLNPLELCYAMYSGNPFIEAPKIGDYIRRNSKPEDEVFILGSEPEILFYAQRKSASKYIFVYPLTSPYSDALLRQQILVNNLMSKKPLYIIFVNYPFSIGYSKGAPNYMFTEISRLIDSHYHQEAIAFNDGPSVRFLVTNDNRYQESGAPGVYIYRRNTAHE